MKILLHILLETRSSFSQLKEIFQKKKIGCKGFPVGLLSIFTSFRILVGSLLGPSLLSMHYIGSYVGLSLWRRTVCKTLLKAISNSITYNSQKICSCSRRPKTILEITKKPHFSKWSTILLFTSFSRNLLTTERRLTGW